MMNYLINGLFIFIAKICDVSLGTIRIVLLARGLQLQASIIGFFEVLIWVIVVSHIINHLDHPFYYVTFAAGFAFGNYIGLYLENKIAMGNVLIRVMTRSEPEKLLKLLREKGFIVTSVNAEGRDGPIKILFSVVKRKQIPKFLTLVQKNCPQAFYTIEDIRDVKRYGGETPPPKADFLGLFRRFIWIKRR
ncbi:DUF2179 domain-containing protein [Thermodesulfobacterium hydrogeniphilum]|uniref:DUF2179 domain-containing protein n=1 Tax=Thermodesulfobacterium hydrogeniphilum TaxID=161156 RepID=UPI000A041524|nr:DUF2179 domain-containing protein [Thermodesulfobacterium hydrogeniphilum]